MNDKHAYAILVGWNLLDQCLRRIVTLAGGDANRAFEPLSCRALNVVVDLTAAAAQKKALSRMQAPRTTTARPRGLRRRTQNTGWPLATLKQAPTLFVSCAPAVAFHLDPVALLARSIRCISTLRHNAFEFHAIGGLQQLEAVVEAL